MGRIRQLPSQISFILGKRVWALALSSLSAVFMVASGLITSRLGAINLTAEELQMWFLMLGALPFCMLLDLGSYSILPGKLSYHSQDFESGRLNKYIATFFQTAIITVIAFATLAAAVLPWIGMHWLSSDQIGQLAILLILAIVARIVQNVVLGIIFAAGHIVIEKSLKTLGSITAVAPMPYLLAHGYSFFSMPWSWLISSAIVLVIAIPYITKVICPILDRSLFSSTLSKEILTTASQFLVAALPGMFIYNILPYRVAQDFGPAQTIQIGLATQISMGITLICAIPTSLFVKKIADAYFSAESSGTRYKHLIKNVRIVSIISSGALATVFIYHEEIFQLWLGKHISFDPTFLLLYLIAIWLEIQQTTMTMSLVSTGYVNFWRVTLLSALLTLIGYTPLIDWLGFSGVAVACLVAQSVTCHYSNTKQTLIVFGLPLRSYFLQHTISLALVGLIILFGLLDASLGTFGILISSGMTGLALIITFLGYKNEQD